MLSDAGVQLAAMSTEFTLVARTMESLENFRARVERPIHTLPADWNNRREFLKTLTNHFESVSTPDLTVAWLHDDELGPEIAGLISKIGRRGRFIQIRGSGAMSPEAESLAVRNLSNIEYEQVILGFMIENGASRWLTHAEICVGVMRAVEDSKAVSVVGVTEPWSARPGL